MREHRAALHGASVEEHGAGAALARVAADVRSGEAEPVAKRVDEERPTLDLQRARLAVHDDRYGAGFRVIGHVVTRRVAPPYCVLGRTHIYPDMGAPCVLVWRRPSSASRRAIT